MTEIANLESEITTENAELRPLPAKCADLILGDDPAKEITKLENRERELEFLVERHSVQMDALKRRLNELRRTELAPRIEFHKLGLMPEIERAALALKAATDAAKAALQAAVTELGDSGCHSMPVVNIGYNRGRGRIQG